MRKNTPIFRSELIIAAFATILVIGVTTGQDTSTAADWTLSGHDTNNTRSQPLETRINTSNVSTLGVKWTLTTGSDVSATPTVANDTVYVPDWAGNLYAVRAGTGQLLWSRKISEYNGQSRSVSRVSPAIFGDMLILGDNIGQGVQLHAGANMFAVDRGTGALRWITKVDAHPAAVITSQPVVSGNVVYVGVSSNEEGLATDDGYMCCTFRGSVVALNANTGPSCGRRSRCRTTGDFLAATAATRSGSSPRSIRRAASCMWGSAITTASRRR